MNRTAIFFWLFLLPANPSPADEMRFSFGRTGGNCASCQWIAAQGEITSKTPTHFIDFLNLKLREGVKYEVRFHSTSGDLTGALILGSLIRDLGLHTGIARTVLSYEPPACGGTGPPCDITNDEPGECLSACAYAFAGGVERRIDKADRIGVHQFYDQEALKVPNEKQFTALDRAQDQLTFSVLLGYLAKMGVSAEFSEISSKTLPNEITYLDQNTIQRTGIGNMYWSAEEWRVIPYGNGAMASIYSAYGPSFSVSASIYCRVEEIQRAEFAISFDVSRYMSLNFGHFPVSGAFISPTIAEHSTSELKAPLTDPLVHSGVASLTFDVTATLPSLVAARGVSVTLQAPMVFHRFYPDVVTLTGINFAISEASAQAIDLALRNCI